MSGISAVVFSLISVAEARGQLAMNQDKSFLPLIGFLKLISQQQNVCLVRVKEEKHANLFKSSLP